MPGYCNSMEEPERVGKSGSGHAAFILKRKLKKIFLGHRLLCPRFLDECLSKNNFRLGR